MNNLPMKEKNNLFEKLKGFFGKFFKKNETISDSNELKENIKEAQENNSFIESLKREIDVNENKIDLIEEIDKNPDLIYEMPDDRLKQLIKLYDEKILEIQAQTEELNKKISKFNKKN